MQTKDSGNNDLITLLQNNPSSHLEKSVDFINPYNSTEEERYLKEYNSLKEKYERQCKSIDSNIRDILSGNSIELSETEKSKYNINEDLNEENNDTKIETYWYTVLINSKYFYCSSMDKEILIHMINISIEDLNNDHSNFEVVFHFNPNDYFKHETITKKYYYDSKTRALTHAKGFDIQWNDNTKNPTIEFLSNKKEESFFDIFNKSHCIKSFVLEDEGLFFRKDLFIHHLEYYLDIKDQSRMIESKDYLNQLSLKRTINKNESDLQDHKKIRKKKKKPKKENKENNE